MKTKGNGGTTQSYQLKKLFQWRNTPASYNMRMIENTKARRPVSKHNYDSNAQFWIIP